MAMALFDTTFAPYVPFGSRTLQAGASGTDVAVLQAVYDLMLATMNPATGPIGSPIGITGTFDAATSAAVKAIQTYFGLVADGIVGPATYFVFGQGVGAFTTYGGPVYGSRQLQVGNTGGDVTILQNRLNNFRYATLIGHPANGVFDSGTAAAVLAFKADAEANGDTGFPSNPIAGFGFYNASWIYTFAGGRAMEVGRNGFDVVFLQALLTQLNFYTGRLDGVYGPATIAAVKAFQASVGITADGVVGPVTFYNLGLANNVAAPSPLGVAWPPPVPKVTVVSVGLTSTTSDLHPYGEATLVINEAEGFESLDVVGNFLPPPPPPFTQFAFTLTNPSGTVVAQQPMVVVNPGPPPDWAGTYSPGVKSIPTGIVTVYAATPTGTLGPSVLTGDLRNGH
jgi:peptidoglycan hydrolase-like protein with peptidoglycan-binding domain